MSRLVQLLGVERNTETKTDTWSKGLRVGQSGNGLGVDLSLDERRVIELVLGTDFKVDTRAGSAVIDGLGTDFSSWGDLVVVRTSVDAELGLGGDRGSEGRSKVAQTSGISVHGTSGNIKGEFGTENKAIVAKGGITNKGRSLKKVEEGTTVEIGLRKVEIELSVALVLVWEVSGQKFTLETWNQSIAQFNFGVQSIDSGPALGKSKASSLVGVLGFKGAKDGVILGVGLTLDSESNTVGGLGLDFKVGWGQVVEISVQEIVGRL